MKYEYRIWNITKGWKLMKATTLEQAQEEILAKGPYGEEAVIRDVATGLIYRQNKRRNEVNKTHGIDCDCCPRW